MSCYSSEQLSQNNILLTTITSKTFQDYLIKFKDFKALNLVQSNSRLFMTFKAPYRPCLRGDLKVLHHTLCQYQLFSTSWCIHMSDFTYAESVISVSEDSHTQQKLVVTYWWPVHAGEDCRRLTSSWTAWAASTVSCAVPTPASQPRCGSLQYNIIQSVP